MATEITRAPLVDIRCTCGKVMFQARNEMEAGRMTLWRRCKWCKRMNEITASPEGGIVVK